MDHYVDGSDASRANWMRFVNCASTEERQNVVACQYRGQIYYQLVCQIDVGVELFVWYREEYAAELSLLNALADDEAEDTCDLSPPSLPCWSCRQSSQVVITDLIIRCLIEFCRVTKSELVYF